MAEEKKTDFSEADRVMQQLRAQLAADSGIPAEVAPAEAPMEAPTQEIQENKTMPEAAEAPEVEEAPEAEEVPEVEEIPEETLGATAPDATEAEEIPEETLGATAPDATEAEEIPEAEEAPEVEEVPEVEEIPEAEEAPLPVIEDDTPFEIVEAEVEAAAAEQTVEKKRKKRMRIPRLSNLAAYEPQPLDTTAKQARIKRAAALADEAEDSLYWQQTPMGREPRYAPQRGVSVVPPAAQRAQERAPTPKKKRLPRPAAPVAEAASIVPDLPDIASDVIEEEVLGLTPAAAAARAEDTVAEQAPVAPVIEEQAPVDEPTAPVMEEKAPVAAPVVPVTQEQAPIDEPLTPIAAEGSPVDEPTAPVMEEKVPVAAPVVPVTQEQAPIDEPLTPIAAEKSPVDEPTAPVTEEKAPIAASAAAAADEPVHGNEFLTASRRRGLRGRAMREKMAKKAEDSTELTVEQLLSDIFGEGQGPAGRAWLTPTDDTPAAGAPAVVDTPPAAVRESTASKETLRDDAPTVVLGGQTLVLPDEATLAKGLHVAEAKSEDGEEDAAPADAQEAADAAREDAQGEALFSAFSVKRRREGALPRPKLARRSADQLAFKRALEESEEELELLVDLDYEEELGEVVGFEKIKAYHERRLNGKIERRSTHRRRHKQKYEYTAHAHDIGLAKFYAKQRRTHIISLALMVFLLLVLLMFERSAVIRTFFGETVGNYHEPLYLSVGLLLFLAGVAILRRHVFDGLWQLLRLAPNDNSLCAVIVLVTLAYHVLLFFVPLEGAMTMFLSPAMAALCLLSLSEFFNWYREFSAFRVVSSKQQKYALLPRASVGGKEGNARERLFEKEKTARAWYVRPVGFIRNYFANTKKKSTHRRWLGALLLMISALSVALALFVLVLGGELTAAVHTAFVSFLLTAPAVSVLATSLPMFYGTCFCLGRRGAIIGESPLYEAQGKVELVLPDDACFKQMPHEQFELVKGCDTLEATVMIRALLDKLHSALAPTVEVADELRLSPDAVTLTDISERGVAAVVAGERKLPVLLGDVGYLQKYGIHVSPKKDGRYEEIRNNMLCVAVGNRLTALFIARYRPEEGMSNLAEALESEGVQLVIRSADPGIHDGLLKDLFADADRAPRVMKPMPAESDLLAERVDADVVAVGSARDAAHAFVTCRRIRRAVRLGRVWQWMSLLLGVGLAAVLTVFGYLHVVPAYAVVLYGFLWSGAHAMSAYFTLRDKGDAE